MKTIRFKDQTEEALWAQIMDSATTQDDLLTVSTALPKSKLAGTGLISKHSYTILDAKEGLGARLVQIRNPWAVGEWTGDWCDNSPLWTDEAKAFFAPTLDDDDGTFWMSFEDVVKFFSRLNICFCEPKTKVTRLPFQIGLRDEQFEYVQLHIVVPQGGKIQWIGLHQPDKRIKTAPPYTDLTLLIFKKDGENHNYEPHGAFVSYKNFYFDEVNLERGEYQLYLFTSGRNLENIPMRDVTVTLHRDCECMVEHSHSTDIETLQEKLIAYSRTGDETQYLDGRLKMYYVHDRIHVWSVENNCEDHEMEVLAKLGLNNMHTCLFCEDGNEEYPVVVPITEKRLITAAVITNYKKRSGLTRNMSMTGRPV